MKRLQQRLLFFLFFVVTISCGPKAPKEKILAQVGPRTISVEEFRRRVELTVRPNVPAADDKQYKNILLNNLIIEKLQALEADKNDKVEYSETFKAFIQGIQEQVMREQLFYKEAFNKVRLDSLELKKAYTMASREYDVEFYTITNKKIADGVKEKIKSHPDSVQMIFDNLWQGKARPKHTIKYKDPDAQPIIDALFTEAREPNTVLGPIQIDDANWIMMKVVDYRTVPAIGQDAVQRWSDVKEKLTMSKATVQWGQYIKSVMKGKEIHFETATFNKLANLVFAMYKAPTDADKNAIYKKFWQSEEGVLTLDSIGSEEAILELPFFTIDHQVWTVRDFRTALMSHPLVYRKTAFNNLPFRESFKLAIADMIRDRYLSQEAFKKGLDKNPEVVRTTGMWKDAMIASRYRDKYMSNAIKTNQVDSTSNLAKVKFYDNWIASLEQEYKNDIKIDFNEFEPIEVTRINMFAMQQNVPYPVAVPGFPLTVTDGNLDYAKSLNEKK
jgi:hypothetical protein